MPIVAGATYVFDLGYYDYRWWAKLHAANCRIVTRLKKNTPLTLTRERLIPAGGIATSSATLLSDRIGHLPARQAGSRSNPMSEEVREVRVRIDTGKVLRILTNDLLAPAHEIADLYKQRWQIDIDQSCRLSRLQGLSGWYSHRGGGKRRQGGGVARIVLRLAMVAASAVTSFAEPAPALIERLRSRPFCTQL